MTLIKIDDFHINPAFVSEISVKMRYYTDGTPSIKQTKISMSNGNTYITDTKIEDIVFILKNIL